MGIIQGDFTFVIEGKDYYFLTVAIEAQLFTSDNNIDDRDVLF